MMRRSIHEMGQVDAGALRLSSTRKHCLSSTQGCKMCVEVQGSKMCVMYKEAMFVTESGVRCHVLSLAMASHTPLSVTKK